jgi:CRISPR-associated exonuclease Cas4
MTYHEDDLLPISALQHLLFCERQCALIHIERLWAENRLTAEGRHLHERAHDGAPETRGQLRTVRGLSLRSLEWGIVGQADVVEFLAPDGVTVSESLPSRVAAELRDWSGWTVTPVEYKRGKPKKDDSDRVQLCAQALCLEEMLGVRVPDGALYYGTRKRRTKVPIDDTLRQTTARTIERLQEMVASGRTPSAVREPKCSNCSLVELCLPDALAPGRLASRFVEQSFAEHVIGER